MNDHWSSEAGVSHFDTWRTFHTGRDKSAFGSGKGNGLPRIVGTGHSVQNITVTTLSD